MSIDMLSFSTNSHVQNIYLPNKIYTGTRLVEIFLAYNVYIYVVHNIYKIYIMLCAWFRVLGWNLIFLNEKCPAMECGQKV